VADHHAHTLDNVGNEPTRHVVTSTESTIFVLRHRFMTVCSGKSTVGSVP